MKKTLLATAIATAMVASGAQAATVYSADGTQVDLYGNVQLGVRSVDNGDESQEDIFDNGTTLGIAAEHQVNEGLTGYLKLELDGFDADELKSNDYGGGDTAYAGLKGNFGDVRLGSYDVLVDDWVKDPVDGSWYAGVTNSSEFIDGVNSDREGDQLRYISPSLNGLQFAVGTQYKGDAEDESNYTLGNAEVDGDEASFFGGVKYTAGALTLSAAYDDLGTYDGDARDTVTGADLGSYDAGDAYGVAAQFAATNELTLSAKIERFDGSNDTLVDTADMYAVKANYAYGMGNVYGTYQYLDVDFNVAGVDDESANQFMLGADYYLTPALAFFIETTQYDFENDVDDFVATGLAFSF